MSTADHSESRSHAEAETLTWFATGALAEGERQKIALHLESCAECRAELRAVTALHGELRNAFEAEPAPSPRVKLAVLARIDAERSHRPAGQSHLSARMSLLERIAAWLRAPLVPRWAPAAALLLILIQAGLLFKTIPNQAIPSSGVTTRGLSAPMTRLSVVFNPATSEAQIRQLLATLGGRIVDGPMPDGVYLVELTVADPKEVSDIILAARLRKDVLQSIDVAPP